MSSLSFDNEENNFFYCSSIDKKKKNLPNIRKCILVSGLKLPHDINITRFGAIV